MPDEDIQGKDAVILLSHEFWQSRLGGSADRPSQTLTTSGRQRTVVGIMPPGFTIEGQRADYMTPYGWTIELLHQAGGRGSSHAIARLRDGVSFEQGETDLKAIAAQREKEAPQLNTGWSVSVVPIHELMVGADSHGAATCSAAAVLLVLLIACVNVANLLLAQSYRASARAGSAHRARRRSATRLVRQLLTESLLLALAGAVTGSRWRSHSIADCSRSVVDRIPVPRLQQVTLDVPVVGSRWRWPSARVCCSDSCRRWLPPAPRAMRYARVAAMGPARDRVACSARWSWPKSRCRWCC